MAQWSGKSGQTVGGCPPKVLWVDLKVACPRHVVRAQVAQHRGCSPLTMAIPCHCPDIRPQISGICHGDKIRRCLHLRGRILSKRMHFYSWLLSPKGGVLPFWADKMAFTGGQLGIQSEERPARDLGSKSWPYSYGQIK